MDKSIKVEVPVVPNYIRVGKLLADIKDFTDDQLKELGEQ